ncbi:hypothetical protein L1887_06643 [Cichorium endivia]|nr:hypothetical protein L1887_06643 [Cichorium endivia]
MITRIVSFSVEVRERRSNPSVPGRSSLGGRFTRVRHCRRRNERSKKCYRSGRARASSLWIRFVFLKRDGGVGMNGSVITIVGGSTVRVWGSVGTQGRSRQRNLCFPVSFRHQHRRGAVILMRREDEEV